MDYMDNVENELRRADEFMARHGLPAVTEAQKEGRRALERRTLESKNAYSPYTLSSWIPIEGHINLSFSDGRSVTLPGDTMRMIMKFDGIHCFSSDNDTQPTVIPLPTAPSCGRRPG